MAKKEKRKGSTPESATKHMADILKAALFSVLLSVVLLLFGAALISAGVLPENYTYICVAAACVLGSLFGGSYATRKIRKATLLVGLGTGITIFMLLLAFGLLWSGGNLDGRTGMISMGLCLCGGGLAGIFGGVPMKKRR